MVVLFLIAGTYAGWRALNQEGRTASHEASARAASAAKTLSTSWELMATQVASLATNPAAPEVFKDPSKCQLSFSLDLLPNGHIDLVSPNGEVLCSSHPLPHAGASQAGAPWMAHLASATGVSESHPFQDAITGEPSVAVYTPVSDGNHLLGAVAAVGPLPELADGLAADFGDSSRYSYALVKTSDGRVLSAPDRSSDVTNPVTHGANFYGSAAIPTMGWTVYAGISRASALGPTRNLLIAEAILAAIALVVIVLLLRLIRRRIAIPLAALADVVGDSGPHVDAALASLSGSVEVTRLATAFAQMRQGQAAYEATLTHHALHDPLTGLANRALLADRLERAVAESNTSTAVIYLDLDRFGLINETIGHAAGDQTLTAVAARLVDIAPPGATVARFGADEYVMVCEDTTEQAAAKLSSRIINAIAEPLALGDQVVRISVSMGIAVADRSGSVESLLRDASEAMFRAKRKGGGRREIYEPGSRTVASNRLVLETELRVAIERGELNMLYQPKVELSTGAITGVEALMRWDHPGLGSVPPATFIPVAEQTGMIDSIGRFALDTACAQAARWRALGIDIPMSVNLSARQLDDPDLVDTVCSVIERHGLPAERLCLELTETALMLDPDRAVSALATIRHLGVTLSIDDFGTGYSSLAYLQRFPVHEVKIDRTFISQIVENPTAAGLVDAIVAMAGALHLQVTAEGVETLAQAEHLRRAGCHLAQGYLYARPSSSDAVSYLIGSRNAPMTSAHRT